MKLSVANCRMNASLFSAFVFPDAFAPRKHIAVVQGSLSDMSRGTFSLRLGLISAISLTPPAVFSTISDYHDNLLGCVKSNHDCNLLSNHGKWLESAGIVHFIDKQSFSYIHAFFCRNLTFSLFSELGRYKEAESSVKNLNALKTAIIFKIREKISDFKSNCKNHGIISLRSIL